MSPEPQLTPEEVEELQEMQEDASDDTQEDQFANSQEFQEAYGSPEPEEKMNPSSFIHNAAFKSTDTLRTTFLTEWELGRPMFNVRFLLDMEDISKFYLDEMVEELSDENKQMENKVADYFKQKIMNITDSGMSNEGFMANLNVTKKMDTVRKKVRVDNIQNLKGGKKRR